ncbi:LuxR family transcriptional regulator [Roseobacter sp.]|uniref:LuxR family transcriptional regulator n=1 Tax=Roseobacter sp. TaxID=1907202 RepID=UPI0029672EEA|nr:LuxR family transcriptional regulator [Roseobacter sp.]MDW3180790.1 LuxR family transcriptional regulator [Roseobacter sp.]
MLTGGLSEYFVDNRESLGARNGCGLLSRIAEKFGFSNITYFFVSGRAVPDSDGTLMTTYAKEWQHHYFSRNYEEIDPIVLTGMNKFLPIDWSKIPKVKKNTRRFFGEAKEFGVSDQGVTIPVRGAIGETALVSLNADLAPMDWSRYLRHSVSDFTYFAYLLHREALRKMAQPARRTRTHLTRREKEVLQWAALGKTSWETSRILSLSERTVEFYLSNALAKLGAATKAQAVSKAIHQGHIIADAFVQSAIIPPASPR